MRREDIKLNTSGRSIDMSGYFKNISCSDREDKSCFIRSYKSVITVLKLARSGTFYQDSVSPDWDWWRQSGGGWCVWGQMAVTTCTVASQYTRQTTNYHPVRGEGRTHQTSSPTLSLTIIRYESQFYFISIYISSLIRPQHREHKALLISSWYLSRSSG